MDNDILIEKNKLIDYINNLEINTDNYDTLVYLYKYFDPSLFVKIIEEVMNGNLFLSDFKQIFVTNQYNNILENQIESQEKLYAEYSQLTELLTELNILNNGERLRNLAELDKSAINIEKLNIIHNLYNEDTTDPMKLYYKNLMISKIIDSDDDTEINNLLLSMHDYLLPVDYNHIQLNDYDRVFMNEYSITEDEMKKIKSLYGYDIQLMDGE